MIRDSPLGPARITTALCLGGWMRIRRKTGMLSIMVADRNIAIAAGNWAQVRSPWISIRKHCRPRGKCRANVGGIWKCCFRTPWIATGRSAIANILANPLISLPRPGQSRVLQGHIVLTGILGNSRRGYRGVPAGLSFKGP
jgi:hypothetical protein